MWCFTLMLRLWGNLVDNVSCLMIFLFASMFLFLEVTPGQNTRYCSECGLEGSVVFVLVHSYASGIIARACSGVFFACFGKNDQLCIHCFM